MGHRVLRQVFLIVIGCSTFAFAQSSNLDQLKSKLQQLEQMMQELKSQIVAVEQQQAPPGQPLVATTPPQTTVSPSLATVEHMGETTRYRVVASDNPDSAPRINNEPMDRALRGYFRLLGTGTLIKLGGFVKTDVFYDTNQAGTYYGAYVPSSFPSSDQPHTQNSTVSARPSRFYTEFRQPVH